MLRATEMSIWYGHQSQAVRTKITWQGFSCDMIKQSYIIAYVGICCKVKQSCMCWVLYIRFE